MSLRSTSSRERRPLAPKSLATWERASGLGSHAATTATRLSRARVAVVSANARPSPTTPSLSFLTAGEYDLLRRLSKPHEAFPRRERPAVPRRGRGADGRDHAPPLATGLPLGRGGRKGWRPGSLAASRRGPGRLQGPQRQAGRSA